MSKLYGLVAEFDNSQSLMAAARQARQAGYTRMSAHTPYHVEGLTEILDEKRASVTRYVVPLALVFGAFAGFVLQYWTSTSVYELNVGGRPLVSLPAFIPVTFEVAILVAGLTAIIFMFMENGLPLPYHPIFNAENIDTASHSHFFLCIDVSDQLFDREQTKDFLEAMKPLNVSEVES